MESLFWWKGHCDTAGIVEEILGRSWNPCSVGRVVATRPKTTTASGRSCWNPCSVGWVVATSRIPHTFPSKGWNPCSVGRVVATRAARAICDTILQVGILVLLEGSLRLQRGPLRDLGHRVGILVLLEGSLRQVQPRGRILGGAVGILVLLEGSLRPRTRS